MRDSTAGREVAEQKAEGSADMQVKVVVVASGSRGRQNTQEQRLCRPTGGRNI
jgi:hypothetical protein